MSITNDMLDMTTMIWNVTSFSLRTTVFYQDIKNSDVSQLIEYISPILSVVLGSTGLIFNVINTSVFVHQGVKDCVTLCLLSLSLTDNGSLAFGVMAAGCRIFKTVTESSGGVYFVDPTSVWLLLVQGQFCFYDLSTYSTAFIAVERCLCVLLPFRFKSIFTFKVSFLILSCIYVTTILFHIFFFAYTEFRTVFNPKLNITQAFIYYSPRRRLLDKYLQVFNHLCMSCVALLVILITSGFMIRRLYQSNQFRKKENGHEITERSMHGAIVQIRTTSNEMCKHLQSIDVSNNHCEMCDNNQINMDEIDVVGLNYASDSNKKPVKDLRYIDKADDADKDQANGSSSGAITSGKKQNNRSSYANNEDNTKVGGSKKSNCAKSIQSNGSFVANNARIIARRNLRVIKMVYTLAIICFVCDSARFAIMVAFYANNFQQSVGTMEVLYNVLVNLVYFVQVVNCSINILVYLTCNHSYRKTLMSLLCGWG